MRWNASSTPQKHPDINEVEAWEIYARPIEEWGHYLDPIFSKFDIYEVQTVFLGV